MKSHSSQDFRPPTDFDIQEVTQPLDDEEKTVIQAETVATWERLEIVEKAKTRPYITGIVIAIWVFCIIVGLIRWVTASDIVLLISSPVLLLGPLYKVLKYYFRE